MAVGALEADPHVGACSVFVDTFTNYYFTKRHGEAAGAEAIVPAELLEELNRVHHAARNGRRLTQVERRHVFETALLYEQETTVGPKVKAEVAKFDCPVLTAIVLKPIVRFGYFPRRSMLFFRDFGDTEERIEKAIRSLELAEQAGWQHVSSCIRYQGILPEEFFADSNRYADALRAAS